MATVSAQERFLELLRAAIAEGTLAKLTLGGHRGSDATLQNVFVRPVVLRAGTRLQFVYRHATRDVTKNLAPEEALPRIMELLGRDFRTAHLFTRKLSAELEIRNDKARLRLGKPAHAEADTAHDRVKQRLIDPQARWLQASSARKWETSSARSINSWRSCRISWMIVGCFCETAMDSAPPTHRVGLQRNSDSDSSTWAAGKGT